MGNYYLNGIDLADYGLMGSQVDGSNIAISGAWDMPPRTGKIYHVWPEGEGIEPYLRADELFYGGRDILFVALMQTASKEEALSTCYRLFNDIGAFTYPVPFLTDYGTWNVVVKDEIKVSHIADGWCQLFITMRNSEVNLSGILPAIDNVAPSIDDISFESLGVTILDIDNEFSRPAVKEVAITKYGQEGYRLTKQSFREIGLKLLVSKYNYADFNSVITGLYKLFSSPGARTLRYENSVREFFVKDGFKVSSVYDQGNSFIGVIAITLTEIRVLETWNKLTDNSGFILTDKNGKPLIEILKGL